MRKVIQSNTSGDVLHSTFREVDLLKSSPIYRNLGGWKSTGSELLTAAGLAVFREQKTSAISGNHKEAFSVITIENLIYSDTERKRHALEVFIHVGLVVLLSAACLLILRPFLALIAWGIIIAIAVYPAYRKLRNLLAGRGKLAAVLCSLLFLAVLIVPVVLLAQTMIGGVETLSAQAKNGTLSIPPLPENVRSWPIIGLPLKNIWTMASTNLTGLITSLAPQIKDLLPKFLSASAGIGLTVLQFILSILIAGVLLASASGCAKVTHALANRLFGNQAEEFEKLAESTVRSVTNGILGVAVIQSVAASVGFVVAGLPGAGLWTLIFLFAAVLQVGVLVLVPAAIYMFAIASTTKAVLFLLWCIGVGLMDNILKPLLLGRGVAVPIVVVFMGAIGGFLVIGTIGLFVGAIILSVGYKLFLTWLEGPVAAEQEG
jgi:predicted PurR-regulated permease PerM